MYAPTVIMLTMSLGITRKSRKPSLNENLRVARWSLLIYFGGRVSLRLRKTTTIRINNSTMIP
jgi:hypothetical protein